MGASSSTSCEASVTNHTEPVVTQMSTSRETSPPRSKNGVKIATKIDREVKSLQQERSIAAIDFGTTSCSLAYCLKGNMAVRENIRLVKLNEESQSYRVPSAVLINKNGEIIKFGYEAEEEWNSICDKKGKKDEYFFFKQIKMELLRDRSIPSTYTIKAANGKECYLIEVIAVILKYIKDQLIKYRLEGSPLEIRKASDFNWVITVPAIWKHSAKQMMREAAYMAGIASENSEIKKLTMVDGCNTKAYMVAKKNVFPDQLSLAFEPEVAALHCMKCLDLKDLKSCLVLDVGGGTVDASALTISEEATKLDVLDVGGGSVDASALTISEEATKLDVILPPSGNADYGGTKINKAIWKLLAELVNDPNFEEYSKNEDNVEGLLEIDRKIELLKCNFGKNDEQSSRSLIIRLPSSFTTTYHNILDTNLERVEHAKLDGRRLEIEYDKIKSLFDPAVEAIAKCIDNCFEKSSVEFEAVFLVGGFGGCSYVYKELKSMVETRYSKSVVYKSHEHLNAVVMGAVMFRKDPEVFCARVADATYGTDCHIGFNLALGHSFEYLVTDDDGFQKCKNLFSIMIVKDEKLSRDKLVVMDYAPATHGMTQMSFPILATHIKEPYYAEDRHNKLLPEILKIGEVTVPMPDPTGDKSRKVNLVFDFSDTEIHVEAYDLTSGEKASTVVDFLGDW